MAPLPPLYTLQPDAEKAWRKSDSTLHRLSRDNPLPADRVIAAEDPFSALVTSITHQQVSLAAGRTIHANLVRALGGKVTPRRVLSRSPEQLRAAGLSRSKTAYVQDLAARTLAGDVEFDRFPELADDAIVEELVAVKGIGVWTAKMFLIFFLERPDVFAPEDLGLRLAVSQAYGVPPEKAAGVMEKMRGKWSPYNSVAARVLWKSRHP